CQTSPAHARCRLGTVRADLALGGLRRHWPQAVQQPRLFARAALRPDHRHRLGVRPALLPQRRYDPATLAAVAPARLLPPSLAAPGPALPATAWDQLGQDPRRWLQKASQEGR